jgi:hypothetical protein
LRHPVDKLFDLLNLQIAPKMVQIGISCELEQELAPVRANSKLGDQVCSRGQILRFRLVCETRQASR